MPVEVLGIDHMYLSVRDPARSEAFYDALMGVLGFRKASSAIDGDPHVHYYNRQLGLTLRPARDLAREHDPYAAGLHHLCLRVPGAGAVDRAVGERRAAGIEVSEPREYPEYSDGYYATFLTDPDGIRLEICNFWERRRRRMFDWEHEADG